MKKRILSALLTAAMVLTLLPTAALAAETSLPDWYFLFAIFKNVDADCNDRDGKAVHAKYTMTQEEIDIIRANARAFEAHMSQTGVMRAHVDIVEIDAAATELYESSIGWYIGPDEASPLLEGKVDLDKYDHVFCVVSLNVHMYYMGATGASFENGTGHSCINTLNLERCQDLFSSPNSVWPESTYVHEFLHFMNQLSAKWGQEYELHDIGDKFYETDDDGGKECYLDIMLNRAKGTAGTGVPAAAWKYPPRVLRTMRELSVPSGVTGIGDRAFSGSTTLTRVSIPGSAAGLGYGAFLDCTGLTEADIASGLSSIGKWAFGRCAALTRVSIPASVTSIGECAFFKTALTDIYYGGTEAQWKAIRIEGYNEPLTGANIHYNSSMPEPVQFTDLPESSPFYQPVQWAVSGGITAGTGNGKFSPAATCNQAQILTFLWRANGEPKPAGAVSGMEYYASAAQWAGEQGLTDGTFSPTAPCTRAMAVTYLWKLAGSPSAGSTQFSDVASDASYAQAISWAVDQGVTQGTGNGKFSPAATCTRGQIVTFLYRALV